MKEGGIECEGGIEHNTFQNTTHQQNARSLIDSMPDTVAVATKPLLQSRCVLTCTTSRWRIKSNGR
jgi:hypothetical protein